MPDSCNSLGEFRAPAVKITSRLALTVWRTAVSFAAYYASVTIILSTLSQEQIQTYLDASDP